MSADEKLIVFDFDGVISNSFHDSLYTAIYSYFQIKPVNNLPLDSPLSPQDIIAFEKEYPEFCRQFADLMPLGNFAADYLVTLDILEKDQFSDITTQKEFTAYSDSISPGLLKTYSEIFYAYRTSLQQNQPDSWASLLPPFDNIPMIIRTLAQKYRVAIATSKDINSLTILLAKYGIEDCFEPGSILDKDFADSKREHLKLFSTQYAIPYADIHFIDDKVTHLISAVDLGITCYLAAWGFNTKREYQAALENGCRILELEHLSHILE